jgi:putative ABC transport system permease protein
MTISSAAYSSKKAITSRRRSWSHLPKVALREFRGGIGGFWVFIFCIALGVAVITAVGALSDGLRAGLQDQSAQLLGGDVTFSRAHARATRTEQAFFEANGRLSEKATMRTMARSVSGDDQALVEIKAVDVAYPLVGQVILKDPGKIQTLLHTNGGIIADPILLKQLQVNVGDQIRIGRAIFPVVARLEKEPDALTERLTYGPRVLMSLASLQATGLVQPGTLVRWRYTVQLADAAGDNSEALAAFRTKAETELPQSGFVVADRSNPSPRLTRTVDRLRQFLTLLGLTALMVGGVGVANAVSTFIDRRRKVIAAMKSLGATGGDVFIIFLTQIVTIALIGIGMGLLVGYLVPPFLSQLVGEALPIEARLTPSWPTALTATAYGLLVALLFALWPLGRARLIRPSVLFRDSVAPQSTWPPRSILIASVAIGVLLLAFAVFSSGAQLIALYFCAAVTVVFAAFYGLGFAVTRLARRLPRSRIPELSLAIGNLAAPGGMTRSVVLSLGVGLSLLVGVALVDHSLVDELTGRMPEQAPNYFVLDIPKNDLPRLEQRISSAYPGTKFDHAPMLRGRLVRLKGVAVEDIKAPPEAEWVLTGDRGLSFDSRVPDGSKVVEGEWWPADYDRDPLVSFESGLAKALNLVVGDTVTVNVLGRNVTARIANLREVKWESLSLNFVMVFSPNTLQAAPYTMLMTLTLPPTATLDDEANAARLIGNASPNLTVIRVKDAINAFNDVFAKIMVAIRAAGLVTLLAGALVLAGALATAQRRRILEAVILKTLGATRRRILLSHVAEYALLASVTAGVAIALGSIAAWLALTRVMEIGFTFSWGTVGQALALSMALVLLFGGIGTWSILRARSVPYLRSE